VAESNLHKLLDFVSKFRVQILEKLFINGQVPTSCQSWDEIYQYLNANLSPREVRQTIDQGAEDLEMKDDDWQILKEKSRDFNALKHPTPKLDKEAALAKIETLNGTLYGRCCVPLKNIVYLFERKGCE